MAVTVLDVAQLIGARMQGGTAEQAQVPITEVGLNSAELPAGALFAAVPGTRVRRRRFSRMRPGGGCCRRRGRPVRCWWLMMCGRCWGLRPRPSMGTRRRSSR